VCRKKVVSWFPARIDRSTFIALSLLCGSAVVGQTAAFAQTPLQVAQLPGSQTAQYSLLFVNPTIGADSSNGSEQTPLKTITQALRVVQPNTIIVLAPGTYSAETGETFPLQLKPGTTIKGEPRDRGQNVIIKGSGFFLSRSFARQNVTIVGANQAGLTGVTVSNPNGQGYGLWVESTSPVVSDNTFTANGHDGVSVVGSSAPILRNNYFYQNGANGITIYGTSRPELQENIFEKTGFGINIAQNAAPRIVGNRITQNKDGIVVQGKARPILRNNVVDGNDRDGMVAISESRPNLGTATDPGNNTFLNNGQLDINSKASSQTIPMFGNQIASTKTNGKLDFSGTAPVADSPIAPPTSVASSIGFGQQFPRFQSPSISIPVPAVVNSSNRSGMNSVPETQKTPLFSRPAVTSAARLPAPKPIATQIRITPPTSNPQPSLFNRQQSLTGAIEIPVPPPESGSVASAPTAIPPTLSSSSIAVSNSQGVLPVPRGDAPIGNVGTMPTVPVWQTARNSSDSPPALPSRPATLGVRYRVVVEAISDREQAQVKAIVPGAFTVSSRGRALMQAGAFGEQAKANELLQILTSQGLKASIEPL
jgi:parallel beta-helix repeat protein